MFHECYCKGSSTEEGNMQGKVMQRVDVAAREG